MVVDSEILTPKTSKLILNQNALRFKENIEVELAKSQSLPSNGSGSQGKKLGRSKDAGLKAGARYECIYKNQLRDIRQFYSKRFEQFLSKLDNSFKRNPQYKYILFPYFTLHFTLLHFDKGVLESGLGQAKSTWGELIKQLAFMFGCFILPKYMMKSFTSSIPENWKNLPT